MSLFGSITGLLSSIGASSVGGKPLVEIGRSVLPRGVPSSLSREGSLSSSSAVSSPLAGSRKTTSPWSSSSSLVRRGSSTTIEPELEVVQDVDLSHLNEEERAQIAAVMERAKMLQDFGAYNISTGSLSFAVPNEEDRCEEGQTTSDAVRRTDDEDACDICRRHCCKVSSVETDEGGFICGECSVRNVHSKSFQFPSTVGEGTTEHLETNSTAAQDIQTTLDRMWIMRTDEGRRSVDELSSSSDSSPITESPDSVLSPQTPLSPFDDLTPTGHPPQPNPTRHFPPPSSHDQSLTSDGAWNDLSDAEEGPEMVEFNDRVTFSAVKDTCDVNEKLSGVIKTPEEFVNPFLPDSVTRSSSDSKTMFFDDQERVGILSSSFGDHCFVDSGLDFQPPFEDDVTFGADDASNDNENDSRVTSNADDDREEPNLISQTPADSAFQSPTSADHSLHLTCSNETPETPTIPEAVDRRDNFRFSMEIYSQADDVKATSEKSRDVTGLGLSERDRQEIPSQQFLDFLEPDFDAVLLGNCFRSPDQNTTSGFSVEDLTQASVIDDREIDTSDLISMIFGGIDLPEQSAMMEPDPTRHLSVSNSLVNGDIEVTNCNNFTVIDPERPRSTEETNDLETHRSDSQESKVIVQNFNDLVYNYDITQLYTVSEQAEVENPTSPRSFERTGSLESSPTFGTFKRCPSYSNILALPTLSITNHVACCSSNSSQTPSNQEDVLGSGKMTEDLMLFASDDDHTEILMKVETSSQGSAEDPDEVPDRSLWISSDEDFYENPCHLPPAGLLLCHQSGGFRNDCATLSGTSTSMMNTGSSSEDLISSPIGNPFNFVTPFVDISESPTFSSSPDSNQVNCLTELVLPDSTSVSVSNPSSLSSFHAQGRAGETASLPCKAEHLTDIVRRMSLVSEAEGTILWLDSSSPVGQIRNINEDKLVSVDSVTLQSSPLTLPLMTNSTDSFQPMMEISLREEDPSNPKDKTSDFCYPMSDYCASEPTSNGSLITSGEEQFFPSDEELREIDLDEDIPPKHLLVRRTSRPKLPFCSSRTAPAFGQRVSENGLSTDSQIESRSTSLEGPYEGPFVWNSMMNDKAESAEDASSHNTRRIPVPRPGPPASEGHYFAPISGPIEHQQLKLAEVKKIHPIEANRSQSADSKRKERPLTSASRCPGGSKSLSIERKEELEHDHFDRQQRQVRTDFLAPTDVRTRRQMANIRSKSAEARPRNPETKPPPRRSYSDGDRDNDACNLYDITHQIGSGSVSAITGRDAEVPPFNHDLFASQINSRRNHINNDKRNTGTNDQTSDGSKVIQNFENPRQNRGFLQQKDFLLETNTSAGKLPPVVPPKPLKIRPKVPPRPRIMLSKSGAEEPTEVETEPKFVSVFGLEVPTGVHSWMLRVKDEVKIVTATKRLRLDEAEEVRIMEAELAERSRKRRKNALKEEQEERARRASRSCDPCGGCIESRSARQCTTTVDRRSDSDVHTKHFLDNDQERIWKVMNKGQNSHHDPLHCSAPVLVENDRDTWCRYATPSDKSGNGSERTTPKPIHLGISVLTQRINGDASSQPVPIPQPRSSPRRRVSDLGPGTRSPNGPRASTTSLPMMLVAETGLDFLARECDALMKKKEKIDRLQKEIDRRRQHLEDTLHQCEKLRREAYRALLTDETRSPEHARREPYGPSERGPSECGQSERGPSERSQSERGPVAATSTSARRKGLIKPIDYPIDPEKYYVRCKSDGPESHSGGPGHASDSSVYSSYEYLVHRSCDHSQTRRRGGGPHQRISTSAPPAWSSLPTRYPEPDRTPYSSDRDASLGYSETEDAYFYGHGTYGSSSHDSGVGGSLAGTDLMVFRSDREQTPPPAPNGHPRNEASRGRRRVVRKGQDDGQRVYPPASTTPPMPILDDVANRSRTVLRGMGSRPLSDEMERYFHAEEPLSLMYKTGSDRSITDTTATTTTEEQSSTIDRRQPLTSSTNHHRKQSKYPFPTKRILLTSDSSKDKTLKGFGVKLRNGLETPPWSGEINGVYVTYIYPGSSADQLHGELQEGDLVLEVNGETLYGRTEDELRQVLSRCSGEMELVVKHTTNNFRRCQSNTMSTIQTDSNRSSYDNIPHSNSSSRDPAGAAAAAAAAAAGGGGIDNLGSCGLDKDSSRFGTLDSQTHYLEGTFQRSSVFSERPPPPSRTVVTDANARNRLLSGNTVSTQTLIGGQQLLPDGTVSARNSDNFIGEIQLQLRYDELEEALNVHVIQGRHLQPSKGKTGCADPFVKVYLLPYTSKSESKRRAKCIPRTLNPEWHRTLVFLNVPRNDLHLKTLDVSVWDRDNLFPDQLLGRVILELSDPDLLDNRPRWYRLSYEECGGPKPPVRLVPYTDGGASLSGSTNGSTSTPGNTGRRPPLGQDDPMSGKIPARSPWTNPDRLTPSIAGRYLEESGDGWTGKDLSRRPSPHPESSLRELGDRRVGANNGGLVVPPGGGQDVYQCQHRMTTMVQHQQPRGVQIQTTGGGVGGHQRNSVYPVNNRIHSVSTTWPTDPGTCYRPDVIIEAPSDIKYTAKPQFSGCFSCLLQPFTCCSRSQDSQRAVV